MAPSAIVALMAGQVLTYRPESDELREKIIERAAEKDVSVNEWLNRVVKAAIVKGGKLKITTTTEAEF